jgi:hypothetical protein
MKQWILNAGMWLHFRLRHYDPEMEPLVLTGQETSLDSLDTADDTIIFAPTGK